jgi:hypothetical protein
MAFDRIRRAARFCVNKYRTNNYVKHGANTVGIYAAGKLIAAGSYVIYHSRDLETLIDMATPVAAGLYAADKSKNIGEWPKFFLHLGIASFVGYDMAESLCHYSLPHHRILGELQEIYSNTVYRFMKHRLDIMDEGVPGAILGAASKIIKPMIGPAGRYLEKILKS